MYFSIDYRYHRRRIRVADAAAPRQPPEIAMNMKRSIATVAAAACMSIVGSTAALAQDSTAESTTASQASLAASGMLIDGSIGIIRAGAHFTVAAVTPLANASVIVVRDVATGSEASIRVAGDVARAGSIAVGDTVSVVAEAVGASLIVGGKLVAFVPNEVGRALVYQARSTQI
jgi:hypothetical protein